jgi:hypothetical protein
MTTEARLVIAVLNEHRPLTINTTFQSCGRFQCLGLFPCSGEVHDIIRDGVHPEKRDFKP